MSSEGLAQAQDVMRAADVPTAAIAVFEDFYRRLESGETGMIPEADVDPLVDVPAAADLQVSDDDMAAALDVTAIIKLNGGLGTSMGMQRAKSLLPVRGDSTFLDVIVEQVLDLRRRFTARLPLILMNSFSTREDTLAALADHPGLPVDPLPLDFLQNREPKLRADDLTPVSWPADPNLQWCPPGHGDLYTALQTSGVLQALLDNGFRYASVSNSDNLGAAPDARMAGWFAGSGAPYAAEVCRRTAADVKGGYLVVRKSDGALVLRETAQTPEADAAAAGDITRHRYFHTNNLWFDLRALDAVLRARDGVLGLPLIRNRKTVDPTDPTSTPVIQIESAMGAAIEKFAGATAIEVPRTRFLPVKTTNDLLLVRSDVYAVADDHRLLPQIDPVPDVALDERYYKLIDAFDARFPAGPPSLVRATSLRVQGDWTFAAADIAVVGDGELLDQGSPATIPAGSVIGG